VKNLYLIIILTCVLLLALLFILSKKNLKSPVKTGDKAPLFTLPDEAGVQRSLTDYKGNNVVLTYEIPLLSLKNMALLY
jgi:hypothetical protein